MQQVLTKAYRTMHVINQDEAFDTLNHVKQTISSSAGVSLWSFSGSLRTFIITGSYSITTILYY